jgi:addiction module RelE/StbE family toxin
MRIRWTTVAADDLTTICDYIQEHDGQAQAQRVALSIHQRIDSLREFPLRARAGRVAETRELVIANLPYLVIYRVKGHVVEIARVLHGAQRWP